MSKTSKTDTKISKADTRPFKGILARIRSIGVKWSTWGPMDTDEQSKAFMRPLKGISGLFGNKVAPNTWGSMATNDGCMMIVAEERMTGFGAAFSKSAPWSTWGDMKTDAMSLRYIKGCLGIRALFSSL